MATILRIAGAAFLAAAVLQVAGILHLDAVPIFTIFAGVVLFFCGELLVRIGKPK